MQPEKHGSLGAAAGTAVIVALVLLGYHLLTLAPAASGASTGKEDNFFPIIHSSNPSLIKDQYKMRDISRVARTLEPDGERLQAEYDQFPPFRPPADPHLTQRQVDRYINAYNDAANEIAQFRRNKVGKKPGIFGVFAVVGMIQGLYKVATLRSLVANQMTNEEFDWLRLQIMEAALYCVQYNLDHGKPSPEQRDRLTDLRERLYVETGVREEHDDGTVVIHPEHLHLDSVPRGNLELFLDNYQRINYVRIHFNRPTPVTFNREAILAAAAANPP